MNDIVFSPPPAFPSFEKKLFHAQAQFAVTVDGGDFDNLAWRTRPINTVLTNEITGASLASNQITLPAATYHIHAWAVAYNVDNHQAKLYDVTGAADLLLGSCMYANVIDNHSIIHGRFTLAASSALEIRHQCSAARLIRGMGNASDFTTEVYLDAQIWKVG